MRARNSFNSVNLFNALHAFTPLTLPALLCALLCSQTIARAAPPGTVVGWGWNAYGQTTPPDGLTNAAAIAAGAFHSLALRSDGTVAGWGSNADGEATPPDGLTNVAAIAAAQYHSLALKHDGTIVGWGNNS